MSRIISTNTIRPERLNGTKIDLGPSDLPFLSSNYIQRGLLFHKPPTQTTLSLVKRLKESFAQALTIFYPLAGRLISVDNNDTVSFFIDCNGAGAEFIHATADGSVTAADILDPVDVPEALIYSFFTMNDVLNHDAAISELPLLSVQVTELAEAVFVACSLNHCVADGTFFWHFFRSWSDIACDATELSILWKPCVFSRGFLEGIVDLPIRIPKRSLDDVGSVFKVPGITDVRRRVFRFSKASVAELKARANSEIRRDRDCSFAAAIEISSLQAVMAHIWISVTKSRRLASDEVVIYGVAVGLRQRISLAENLPEEYMGNMLKAVAAKSTAEEIVQGGIGAASLLLKNAIASQTVSEVRNHLKTCAERLSDLSGHVFGIVNKLSTGSSARFDVYGCDFGWGRPVGLCSGPGMKFDGMLNVFPGSKKGSIDFEAYLSQQVLCALDSDPDFTQSLS